MVEMFVEGLLREMVNIDDMQLIFLVRQLQENTCAKRKRCVDN